MALTWAELGKLIDTMTDGELAKHAAIDLPDGDTHTIDGVDFKPQWPHLQLGEIL